MLIAQVYFVYFFKSRYHLEKEIAELSLVLAVCVLGIRATIFPPYNLNILEDNPNIPSHYYVKMKII